MKVPGRPRPPASTPAQLPDQPYMLMAAAHMQQLGTLQPQAPASAPVAS